MISEKEALAAILGSTRTGARECLPLSQSDGRFAAGDLCARLPLPRFDNSSMDGYAVVASACRAGERLHVIGQQAAGIDHELTLRHGEAVRIFTGAPIPAGADAVVMQEDVTLERDHIVVNAGVAPGENIRRSGCDLAAGQKILNRGERLAPQHLSLLAAQGLSDVEVGAPARVAIISTGDEVAQAGAELQPGQIYDSNAVMLQALARRFGGNVADVVHCGDDVEQLKTKIARGVQNDVLIISGGVSVGDRDFVKATLRECGAEIELWRVAVKPGKPFLFARAGECLVFGLPGNPVSAFVTFLLLVRPALLKMAGAGDDELPLPEYSARLTSDAENDGTRPHYVRGELKHGQFSPVGRQESHALYGLSRSNSLLRIPPETALKAGDLVTVQVWC
jgi:molybdopterin molybdotransferase